MSKFFVSFFLAFWFEHSLIAQPTSISLSPELIIQNIVDTIPISVEQKLIFLTVDLNQKPRKFLLDTGAPTILSASLQHELRYDTIVKGKLVDVHEISDSTAFVRINEISIGRMKFKNLPAAVVNLKNSFLGCLGIDGVIGSNALLHLVCKFDIRSKHIILSDSNILAPASKPVLITLDNQFSPYLKINPGPRTSEELLFDTGYNGLYSLCNRNYQFFVSRRRLRNTELAKGNGNNVFGLYGPGTAKPLYLLKLKFIKVNNSRINKPVISTSSHRNSLLGTEVFSYGIVTLDYPRKAFWFQPYQKNIKAINPGNWGFEPAFINGRVCIGLVWSGTLAEKAGLSYGQPILKVNDIKLTDIAFCDMFARDWQIQEELTLEVEINGEIRKIKLTKEFFR